MGAAYQDIPKTEIPAATATFNVVFRVASSFGTAVLAVVLQQSIANHIPGVTSLADAARLHGAAALAALSSAFSVSFWWVAALAAAAVIPAAFIPSRAGGGTFSLTSLLGPGDDGPGDDGPGDEGPGDDGGTSESEAVSPSAMVPE
jgi:hypothetical protein